MKTSINFFLQRLELSYSNSWKESEDHEKYFTIAIATKRDAEEITKFKYENNVAVRDACYAPYEASESPYEIEYYPNQANRVNPQDYCYFLQDGVCFNSENYSHCFIPYSEIIRIQEI